MASFLKMEKKTPLKQERSRTEIYEIFLKKNAKKSTGQEVFGTAKRLPDIHIRPTRAANATTGSVPESTSGAAAGHVPVEPTTERLEPMEAKEGRRECEGPPC